MSDRKSPPATTKNATAKKAPAPVVELAADIAADLVYADLSAPGFTRKRRGRGFSYLTTDGERLSDEAIIKRCKALVIPPAWRDVWICSDGNGHIQCTGFDARERRQYRYHPLWHEHRNKLKFDELAGFGKRLHRIRDRIDADLHSGRHEKRRVVAAAVRLIDLGLVRVGNDAYSKENESYGATTLLDRHVELDAHEIAFDFTAKSGKRRHLEIDDAALARSLRYCQELPGQRLFQYRDERGELHPVSSSDVNDWLREVAGVTWSAKEFRTWGGTVAAWRFADEHRKDPPAKLEVKAAKHAASVLSNTLAVARKYYIHPALLDALAAGEIPPRAKRSRKRLDVAETSVLKFLESLG